jgi:hypothetical protein
MDYAELAIAAAAAEKEATELEDKARVTRLHSEAQRAIWTAARGLGLTVDVSKIVRRPHTDVFFAEAKVDADATLIFTYEAQRPNGEGRLDIMVKPADQLYWNLPPDQETKDIGAGGVYGCFGLGEHSGLNDIETQADVGRALLKIRAAREQWRLQHEQDREGTD